MGFDAALVNLKAGLHAYRKGWYGKHHLRVHQPTDSEPCTQAYIVIVTQRGDVVPWLASQADLLAEDWCVGVCGEPLDEDTSS